MPTGTGADVTITLTASDQATEPVEFTIDVGGDIQTVILDPGETLDVTVSVPFGSTLIEVLAEGEVLDSAVVDIAAPTAVVTPPATDTGELGASTSVNPWTFVVLAALALGALALTPRRTWRWPARRR